MKRFTIGIAAAALALASCSPQVQKEDRVAEDQKPLELKAVANEKIEGKLLVGDDEVPLSGRASLQLAATREELEAGRIGVRRFNLVYFEVPQSRLTGRESKGPDAGVLGFALVASAKRQSLKYDRETGQIHGELSGQIDFPQLSEFVDPKRDPERDYEMTPAVSATLQVKMAMKEPFAWEESKEALQTDAEMEIELLSGGVVGMSVAERLDLDRFRLYTADGLLVQYSIAHLFRWVDRLCLQPVSIRDGAADPDPTGDGLDFGRPQLQAQWGKVDVTFEIRDWMYVDEADYKVLTPAEREELLPLVSEDDCIEVYFAQEFVPQDKWGGGVTRSGGQAVSTITSSDQNADFGIDEAHLAHEVGHVLGLSHPGDGETGPIMIDGSSGTVICPSGFQNDNPHLNSDENGDLLQNPLLESTLQLLTATTDCEDGADCGDCPAI